MTPRPLFLVLLFLLALSATAQQPRNELAVSVGRSQFHQLGDAPAVGLSYNRYWTAALSTRFGAFMAAEDLPEGAGSKRIGAYHVSGEVHLLRDRRVSPYAGLGIALAHSSIKISQFDFSSSEMTFAPIVEAGLDVNLTRRFTLGGDVRYLYYDAELGSRFGYQLNPLTVLVSAKFRY
jgi:opacity protein-like surface antigen